MDVFETPLKEVSMGRDGQVEMTYKELVEEELDELLFDRTRCEHSVEISAEKLGDKVAEWSGQVVH